VCVFAIIFVYYPRKCYQACQRLRNPFLTLFNKSLYEMSTHVRTLYGICDSEQRKR